MKLSEVPILSSVSDSTKLVLMLNDKEMAIKWSDYKALLSGANGTEVGTEFTTNTTLQAGLKNNQVITLSGTTSTITIPYDEDIKIGSTFTVFNTSTVDPLAIYLAAGVTADYVVSGTSFIIEATAATGYGYAVFTKVSDNDWMVSGKIIV